MGKTDLFNIAGQPEAWWSLYMRGREARCEVRHVSGGLEVNLWWDGQTLYRHVYSDPGEARDWAARKREQLASRGWLPVFISGESR